MPAYEMQWVEPEKNQEEQEQLRKRLEQEIDACTEVRKHERNKLKQFLEKRKIYTISEMDYLLRKDYEGYLRQQF